MPTITLHQSESRWFGVVSDAEAAQLRIGLGVACISIDGCLVDTAVVACGAVVAAGAWRNRGTAVAAALAMLAVIGIRGVGRRR